MMTLEESIAHWEALASEAEEMARWNRERGLDLSAPGSSPGDHRAQTYRRAAEALRIERDTGVSVCVCCYKPQGRGVHIAGVKGRS